MQIYEYPKENRTGKDCVLALGFFDGVHIAHRDLIKAARALADERRVELGILTFGGEIKSGTRRIYSDAQKAEIFEALGADFTVIYDFSAIKDMSTEEFVRKILIDELCCSVAVAGYNFRFGKGASGDAAALTALMREGGGEAHIREKITAPDGEAVSSTRIRDLLALGEVKLASELLGLPYYIKGRVEKGRGEGRTLGFPTLNMPVGEAVLKRGVYRSATAVGERIYPSLTNIGTCPTFLARPSHAETYLIDFSGDLYGEDIRVYLLDFLREEIAFSSPNELKMQINIDKNRVISENGDEKWQELGLK